MFSRTARGQDGSAPGPRIAVVQRQPKRDAGRSSAKEHGVKTRVQEDPDSEMSDSGPAPAPSGGRGYPPLAAPKRSAAPSIVPATTVADELTERLAWMQIDKMRAERGEIKAEAKERARNKADQRRRELAVAEPPTRRVGNASTPC